jgi:hypothetical protein
MNDIIGINISLVKDGEHVYEWNTVYVRGGDVIVLSNISNTTSTVEFDKIEIELVDGGE